MILDTCTCTLAYFTYFDHFSKQVCDFICQNKSLYATLDTESHRRTQLESDLKINAQEIAALRATEKQLTKVGNILHIGFLYISFT